MKKSIIIIFLIFSYYYVNRIVDYSNTNNEIINKINDYALVNNVSCIEGTINNDGIILGYSGLIVDKNKSYINMKGNTFNKELIEYKKDECILNLKNNYDKYILRGNIYENNISIIIDVDNYKYYESMIKILNDNNIKYNLSLFNYIDSDKYIIYKNNNIEEVKDKKIICTNIKYDLLNKCSKYKINSINAINIINDNLLYNIKKLLNNGSIIFIKESKSNLNELLITINYIKSRGYNIVYIDELLS